MRWPFTRSKRSWPRPASVPRRVRAGCSSTSRGRHPPFQVRRAEDPHPPRARYPRASRRHAGRAYLCLDRDAHPAGRTPPVLPLAGDLVGLDAFYVGRLKGIGPVWQLTAVDTHTRWAIHSAVCRQAHHHPHHRLPRSGHRTAPSHQRRADRNRHRQRPAVHRQDVHRSPLRARHRPHPHPAPLTGLQPGL
jgi:hypothetical protein